jgi:hypothetical protein
MRARSSSLLIFSALAALAIGCSQAQETDGEAEAQEANQSSSNWSARSIGDRPNRDVVQNERVAIAIDARGQRHGVYLGRDRETHYVDLSANREQIVEAPQGSHHALALDPSGDPHIAFTSSDGIVHAVRRNGAWSTEQIGARGTVDALAVDATGTVHVASSTYEAGVSTAKHSTKRSGAAAFEHAAVPGKRDREIGFGAFAFAVGRSGTAYMLLSSFESIETAPNVSHSGPTHTYFAKRPAGGTFSVEMSEPSASGGSMVVDANDVVHAVLSVDSEIEDHDTKPVYVRRGASDAAWSAPESVFWDGYYTSLAIDASGTLHLAVTGSRSSFLAHAVKPAGGTWTTEVINSSRARVPSIALDTNGKPLIAYRDDSGYLLAQRNP